MKCRYKMIGHSSLWVHWKLRYGQPSPRDLLRVKGASPGLKFVSPGRRTCELDRPARTKINSYTYDFCSILDPYERIILTHPPKSLRCKDCENRTFYWTIPKDCTEDTSFFCKIIINNIGRSPMTQYNSDNHLVLYWVQGSGYLQPFEAVTGLLMKELLMRWIMVVCPSEMGFFTIVKSLESPSKSIKYYQSPWKYRIFCPWTFMDFHQTKCCVLTTWIFMEIHEDWWFYVDYHENLCFLPWNSMDVRVNFDWVPLVLHRAWQCYLSECFIVLCFLPAILDDLALSVAFC